MFSSLLLFEFPVYIYVLSLISYLLACACIDNVDRDDSSDLDPPDPRRDFVKQMFMDAYGSYRAHAYPHDELQVLYHHHSS